MTPIIDTLEQLAQQAQDTWHDEEFQQRLDDARARLAHMVRTNPLGSVGVALIAGFLIGKITKRGRK